MSKKKQKEANSEQSEGESRPVVQPAGIVTIDGQAVGPAPQPAGKKDADARPTIEEIKRMSVKDMQAFCRRHRLGVPAGREALQGRLIVALHGISERYAGQMTKCRCCMAGIRVTGTSRRDLGDGRTVVVRQVTCRGADEHTYPMHEIIGAAKTKKGPAAKER